MMMRLASIFKSMIERGHISGWIFVVGSCAPKNGGESIDTRLHLFPLSFQQRQETGVKPPYTLKKPEPTKQANQKKRLVPPTLSQEEALAWLNTPANDGVT